MDPLQVSANWQVGKAHGSRHPTVNVYRGIVTDRSYQIRYEENFPDEANACAFVMGRMLTVMCEQDPRNLQNPTLIAFDQRVRAAAPSDYPRLLRELNQLTGQSVSGTIRSVRFHTGEGGEEFKIILVGDAAVGKSAFIKRHETGEFEAKYVATMGVEVHHLTFSTTNGIVRFACWDLAGHERFRGTRDEYLAGADGCIAMFDLTSRVTFTRIPELLQDVERVTGEIPVVVVGNKADAKNKEVTSEERRKFREKYVFYGRYEYVEVSAKSGDNYEAPFLLMIRELLDDDYVKFVSK